MKKLLLFRFALSLVSLFLFWYNILYRIKNGGILLMMEERYQELKAAEKGAYVSIFSYILISILKLSIGIWGHSEALTADGLNNFTDIIASIAVLIGLKIARRPADEEHRYGHWKVETVASMVTSFIMLMVGLEVLYSAIRASLSDTITNPDPLTAYVGIFSSIVMYVVYYYNKKLAKKVNSGALLAAAKDNRSDAWTSIGTSIAIFASSLDMPWLDNMAAVVVGLLIIKTAIDIFKDSAFSLSDGFSKEELNIYKQDIRKIEGIKKVKAIRGRTYGSNVFLDVVVLMDENLTVKQSHNITENIEELLKKEHHVFDIDIHVEPYDKDIDD